MHKVTINGMVYFAQDGELLSVFLQKNGGNIPHPCAGNGICKKCLVTVNGKEELSCQYRIHSDIDVFTKKMSTIQAFSGAVASHKRTENMCFALDIGTTTLALALVSLDDKSIVDVITKTNPQITYGADVISRIEYCRKNKSDDLKNILISVINEMISEFNVPEVRVMYASGNTTMLHLLLGIDCTGMGHAPYTPSFTQSKTEQAENLGLIGIKTVKTLPCISAFVGADIVAGINYAEASENKFSLLVDLGTNAEIVLFSKGKILCTSAAAGPCFEGANITCGMSAVNGAVLSYEDDEIQTVNSAPPEGICGTGLIDIISELLKKNIIDETGYMKCGKFFISPEVFINQADIRQYQLAKSAVYSAIVCLIKEAKISFDNIEKLYISGGFSAKINIESAVSTGLLPEELKEKCIAINNSSLLGTVKYICEKNDLSHITEIAEYIDLSENSDFSHKFIENMML
ncbi:MAG: DUF4445 domain-containing protein [Ruminococcaceae bacterium]|nr:DUF4445 domain-containing protein [Oscillospiraceae bacterium]